MKTIENAQYLTGNRRFAWLFVITMTMVSFLLVSCGGTGAGRDPYTIYVHLSAEPGTLNPLLSTEAVAGAVTKYIYESLLDRDYDTLELKPQLAERYEVLKGGLVYRFHLKKGVLWSDGAEFNADDVVYSFDRIKDPKVAGTHLKVYYIDVTGCRKLNRYTVEFTCRRPYFMQTELLGEMPIVPKHVYDDGTDFNTHPMNRKPIGTGPYVFDRWETRKRIILARNERFRDPKPDIRKIVYRVVPDPNVAILKLKKGELDVMTLSSLQWARQTGTEQFNRDFHKLKYYLPYYNYIGWNAERPFFSDRRVRLAMTHLVNRKAILDKLLFGLGEIVNGTFFIYSKNYSRNLEPWTHDPARARELLREAGWTDSNNDGVLDRDGKKFSFTMVYPVTSDYSEKLAVILKEDLAREGIEMKLNRYEWAVFVQKLNERDFDATSVGWSLGYSGDPYQLWHSSQIKDGSNFCSFRNAEADRLIEAARLELDEARRVAMYHRFNEILHREQPYTFMFCNPSLAAVSKRFDNVKVHTKGLNYLEWKVKARP
ncbi:MAG: peptide-binding protein [Spirochaetes bacterium]|nr:peptide-binding protein [Spirochaetota bacterium]